MTRRWSVAATLVALATAVVVASASAGDYIWQDVARDQAVARAGVITKADFRGLPVTGGMTAMNRRRGGNVPCSGFDPDLSDLVITAEARSTWKSDEPFYLTSEVSVFRTEEMRRQDWKRFIGSPMFTACLRKAAAAGRLGSGVRLVSLRELRFPKVGEATRGIRITVEMKQGSGPKLRLSGDIVVVGVRRARVTLTSTVLFANRETFTDVEAALLRAVSTRLARTT